MPTPTPAARSLWRRVALALVGVLIALPASLAVAGTANAEPNYPPHFNKITASRHTVCKGGKVKFRAMYFKPRSTVTWQVTKTSMVLATGSVKANKKGVVKKTLTFTSPGTNFVTFSGPAKRGGGTLSLTVKITVTSKRCGAPHREGGSSGAALAAGASTGDPSGAGLPVTGAQVALLVLLAGGLLVGGSVLIGASRRRT